MQLQDFLPVIQEQWQQFSQFTLENPAYAASLGALVFLVTALLYSFRIMTLKSLIRKAENAASLVQQSLKTAEQMIQQLQDEKVADQQLLEQENQRLKLLQEQINDISTQLREAIANIATQPELGQSGLVSTPGLQLAQLYPRYQAAVKLICEALIAEKQNGLELKAAQATEAAKLADKSLQLQSLQLRIDSQKSQLANLEISLAEQTRLYNELQLNSQQQILALNAKLQAIESNVSATEKLSVPVETPAQIEPVVIPESQIQAESDYFRPEIEIKEPVQFIAEKANIDQATINEVEAQQESPSERKPVSIRVEPEIEMHETRLESLVNFVEEGGFTSKLKGFFAGRKKAEPTVEPVAVVETVFKPVEPEPEPESVKQQEVATEIPLKSGLAGKFKNIFAKSASIEVESIPKSEPETTSIPPELDPNPASGLAGKFKTFYSNALTKFEKLDESLGLAGSDTPAEPIYQAEPELVSVETEAKNNNSTFSSLGGKFKNIFANKTEIEPEPVIIPEPEPEPEPEPVKSNPLKNIWGKFKS